MTTRPHVDTLALSALALAAMTGAQNLSIGDPNEPVVLANACPVLPGESTDDAGVRSIPSIALLRYFVEEYDHRAGLDQMEDRDGTA